MQTPLADISVPLNTGIAATDLATIFSVPGVANTIVQMRMAYGPANTPGIFNIEMAPASAPNTVANFLSYVNAGSYANTIVHRSAVQQAGVSSITIIQGGSFQSPAFGTVPTNPRSISNIVC